MSATGGFHLDQLLAAPPIMSAAPKQAIGFVGTDLPIALLLASGRPFGHLPWRADGHTPWADQWLESAFPGWARSILEQWHAGAFDHLAHVVFSRADDASQRLFYYVRELQRRGQLRGPRPLVFDIALVRRESSLEHTAAAVLGLAQALDVSAAALPEGIERARRVGAAVQRWQAARTTDGPWFEALARAVLWSDASQWLEAIALPAPRQAPRVLLAGSFPPDGRLHRAVEDAGASVIGEAYVHALGNWGEAAQQIASPGTVHTESSRADSRQADSPQLAIARSLIQASVSPRAMLDRGAWIAARAQQAEASTVILWLTREDEGLAWQLPAMRRALHAAGVAVLELPATQWLADEAVLARITAFCRERFA